ncbi:pyrimidine/purine nucleoside phosphorylase [Luteolibacter sp. SL250]|nr:pyrimidine/purine nucleoside phosphorylase [Luteolibacter sp. SL250]WAC21863.1 pyrimidine/purine nucleoside phosphorylase [Luteolibacter sp. SL250]
MSDTAFTNVTVDTKANIYFDGRVISHNVHFQDGSRKTIGLIYPGVYHFGTAAPELMEIIAGESKVVLDGTDETLEISAGTSFEVPGKSGFTITVADGICEYICSFLPA